MYCFGYDLKLCIKFTVQDLTQNLLKKMNIKYRLWTLIYCCSFLMGTVSQAQEITAVLSSDSSYYQEALSGFQEAVGQKVAVVILSGNHSPPNIPKNCKLILVVGGKASAQQYPDHVPVVYSMVPFMPLQSQRLGTKVHIAMIPSAHLLFAEIRQIQPNLRTLALLWTSDSMSFAIKQFEKQAAESGLSVLSKRIQNPARLPDHLRSLAGQTDALWIAPDPLLVNEKNFTTIRDFAWGNRIPFYAPTAGLAEEGASAAIAVGFREMGRTAALAAHQILSGNPTADILYPVRLDVTINLSSAQKCNLVIPKHVLEWARKVIP
jgi:hypothetical protein